MSRERFEYLQAQAQDAIKQKAARAAELQEIINNSRVIMATQRAEMSRAEEAGDPEAYAQAQTLINMHQDRVAKAEQEQRQAVQDPVIAGSLYDEIRAFLQEETEQATQEELREIKAHMDAVEDIIIRATAYHQELANFAGECERVNHASITGRFNNISLSSPPAWLIEDLLRAKNSIHI